MMCPTCGRDMEPRTHALGAYATITVMTCPVCLTTPEPGSLADIDRESSAAAKRLDLVGRVSCGRMWE